MHFLILTISLAASACLLPDPVDEPAGFAEYWVTNATTKTHSAEVTFYGTDRVDQVELPPLSRTKILEDGIFGVNPTPRDSMDRFAIIDEQGNLIVEQLPADDQTWSSQRVDEPRRDYGYFIWTFGITE